MVKPKCSRCGRVLKDPVSIARGMGPVCAGGDGSASKRHKPGFRHSSGRHYALGIGGSDQPLLLAQSDESEVSPEKSRRTRIQASKTERRVLFQRRQKFQCGLNTRTRAPVVYFPTPEGGWTNSEGYAATHAALEKYLVTYGWI